MSSCSARNSVAMHTLLSSNLLPVREAIEKFQFLGHSIEPESTATGLIPVSAHYEHRDSSRQF